jgi:hypothetical protein
MTTRYDLEHVVEHLCEHVQRRCEANSGSYAASCAARCGAPLAEPITVYHSHVIPSAPLFDLARAMYASGACSTEALMVGFILMARYETVTGIRVTAHMMHRLYVACVHVGLKLHSDFFFNNGQFGAIVGVSLKEMNRVETALLADLRWSVLVNPLAIDRVARNFHALFDPITQAPFAVAPTPCAPAEPQPTPQRKAHHPHRDYLPTPRSSFLLNEEAKVELLPYRTATAHNPAATPMRYPYNAMCVSPCPSVYLPPELLLQRQVPTTLAPWPRAEPGYPNFLAPPKSCDAADYSTELYPGDFGAHSPSETPEPTPYYVHPPSCPELPAYLHAPPMYVASMGYSHVHV